MKTMLIKGILRFIRFPLKILFFVYVIYFSFLLIIYYYINIDEKNNYYLKLLENTRNAFSIFCLFLFIFNVIAYLRHQCKTRFKIINGIEDVLLLLLIEWFYFITPIFATQLIIDCFDLSLKIQIFFNRLRDMFVIVSISWTLCLFVFAGERYILSRFDIRGIDNLKNRGLITQVHVLKKLFLAVIVVITLALVCTLFDTFWRFGASLLASAGIAGIAASLAAQKTLSNMIIGFQLAVTQPIRYDDVLIVEGEWGKVEEITLTYVTVALWDQRRLILPISYFVEKPFQNWTKTSADIIGSIFIYVDYSLPIEKIEEEVIRLCNSTTLWDKKVVCVQVTNASFNYIEIRILASSKDAPTNFDLRCFIRRKIIEYIQINYPKCFAYNRVYLSPNEKTMNN